MLDQYERQVEVQYQGEKYLVRDNGAICRTSRSGHPKRKLDDDWTFGRPSASKGYMLCGSHVVHRIVALAFHEQPSKQHVVDHIDTNRRNNRADNLRWVTRLENLLLNPITLARIVRAYGTLDAFFKDPSAIKDPSAFGERDPDFSWMRTVT
ncbi:MAG: HNH endonuclease signature motif containing protein, partial [Pseudomonas sp.]